MEPTDGRRLRGEQSRRTVMNLAVDVASVSGLDSLTIGTLAAAAGMSKGGIVALFGSKQDLQLAAITAASQVFIEKVVTPALQQPRGLQRLRALVEGWLRYSQDRVFAGGCFFSAASAEFRSRPGPVRDAIATAQRAWREYLQGAIERAMATGELAETTDAAQLAFTISALLEGANDASLLFDSDEPYLWARRAVAAVVTELAPLGA